MTALRRSLPSVALAALGVVPPLLLLVLLGKRSVGLTAGDHFVIVLVAALVATAAALALTALGAWRRDRRAVVTGGAFAAMAALLAVHGAATPGFLVDDNGVISLAGGLTLPAGAVLLVVSALPAVRRPGPVAPLVALMAAAAVAVLLVGAIGLAHPHAVPAVPTPRSWAALAAMSVGIACFALVAVRAATTALLTRRPRDLFVPVGVGLLIAAIVAQYTFHWGQAGFIMGHALEVIGIGLAGVPVAVDAWTRVPSRPLAGDLRVTQVVAQAEAFLGRSVHALLRRLAEKDGATEGHTRRVALLSVQVGEELGLTAPRLRRLALGGLLHDMGKLRVPDAILQKPGPLTDDEFEVIRRHPEWGAALLADLGFSAEVRAVVLDHHERLDGTGYPRGLSGAQMSEESRIVAVCDVYDALVSPRVYRSAWSPDAALDLLRSEAGTAFDPAGVAALETVLEREPFAQAPRAAVPDRPLVPAPA